MSPKWMIPRKMYKKKKLFLLQQALVRSPAASHGLSIVPATPFVPMPVSVVRTIANFVNVARGVVVKVAAKRGKTREDLQVVWVIVAASPHRDVLVPPVVGNREIVAPMPAMPVASVRDKVTTSREQPTVAWETVVRKPLLGAFATKVVRLLVTAVMMLAMCVAHAPGPSRAQEAAIPGASS
jgi:hypothetical protein